LGTSDLAEISLNGSVDDLIELQGVDIEFHASGKDVANLEQVIGQPLPVRGAFTAAGKVLIPVHKDLKIPDLKISIGKNDITGSLDLDLREDKPQLEAQLSLSKLDLPSVLLPGLAGQGWAQGLGQVRPVKLAFRLAGFTREIALKRVDLQAGTLNSAQLRLSGSVENLVAGRGIDLNFSIEGREAANLEKITGQSIPLKGSYALSGRMRDPAQKNYKISDLTLKLGQNNIDGSLDLNLSGKQLRLAAYLTAPRVTLEPVTLHPLPALEALSHIEDLGPLKLAFKLAHSGRKLALYNLIFDLGRKDLIEVSLKGTISDLAAVQGMKLEFAVRGNDLSNFKKMGGPDIPYQGAFSASGQLIDPAPKVYKVPTFNATWGDNRNHGWLELDLSGKRPLVKAELSSDKFDLRPFFDKPDRKSSARAPASKPRKEKERLFSSKPFELDGLKTIDADVKLRNRSVLIPALALNDVVVDILLDKGNLRIKPFTFMVGGGKADIQFDLRLQDNPPTMALAKVIDQLDLGTMLDDLGYPRSIEGLLDTKINLTGQGASLAELMSGLNGNIQMTVIDGRAYSQYLKLLQRYLGSGVLRMLNPFQEKRKYTPINCFVNSIEIKDGLAGVNLLLDTDRTSIFGAGDVNLKTESLDLGIKPTPKKGAGPANISFSFRELSQPFRLGGTLASPRLVIDPGRTAFVIGKMAGALALGPVGLAAFFADVSVGKEDPCAAALEAITQKNQLPDTRKAEDSPKETAAGDQKKKEKRSGGFFRRLFGK